LRRAWAVRELGKSALVASILPVRRVVLELGRRMVEHGRIDQPEYLLHLADCDLNSLLNGYWDGSGVRELVSDRAARRETWLREDAPDVIPGEGAAHLPAVEPSAPVNGVWKGIAVSAGQVTGIGRVVRRAEDGSHLRPGEILVAPATDSSWTPLFLRASGVVMEMGGYLSHGSIVAREYGLPAVANIPGLLRQLKDGDTLRVNGDLGTLERL
jgi:pyruvate,water dikinase